ncbi:glycoside hydrolase family 25 protein [Paraburkholderia dilworthii]|uniref:glycoside hydrolase family 25 protein n=1 Tax=Paraburkholderia dilworthii TaxID=948106 RepID=UPI000485B227|nr:glycoside hydrolase family 25 protein [Paraburkholderia dilworthii]
MPHTLDGSIDVVLDVYHGSDISLADAKSAGVLAVIHKASEGATVQDAKYAKRRHEARGLGLLWGAYHYASGMPVQLQVSNFLDAVQWGADSGLDENTLLCLDFEPSHSGPDMSFHDVCTFVSMVREKTGRWPMIYGGALLRETFAAANPSCDAAKCPLWYARYNDKPVGIPGLWPKFALWQYTDGANGPQPRNINDGHFDRSCFVGTSTELKQQWPLFKQ